MERERNLRELIKELSDLRAISGYEYRVNKKIAEKFMPYADEVRIDALGSVIAVKECGKPNAPKIMIEAHCDEIGMMVTSIDEQGYIAFAPIGGIDPKILPSMEVVIHGKTDTEGVVGIKPDYMLESGKAVKLKDMRIDTGLDADTVKECIAVGDSITMAQSVGELGKKQWSGKTLDDRASVAALIDAMRRIVNTELNADVYAVAAVQEEVGCRGGKTTSAGIRPDIAIAVDVTHGLTPDNTDNGFEVGTGCAVAAGPNIHPLLEKALFETASRHNIKTTKEVCGGETGTDAWEMQTAKGGGVPTALLSIPLKYMHTSVETLAVSDVKATAKLLAAFIADFKDMSEFEYRM